MPTDPPREPHGLLLFYAKACDPAGVRTHNENVRVALAIQDDIDRIVDIEPKGTPDADQ